MPTLHLKATDSRVATDDELREAGIEPDHHPSAWQIMAHQAQTVRALRYGTAPIIINQAMTGDGKSFAGQFMLFNDPGWRTFAMYPTNELANDQKRSLDVLLNEWTPRQWQRRKPDIERVDAARIDEIQTRLDTSRMDALKELLDPDLILTNPDIFHLAMQFAYRQYGTARDFILGEIAQRYRLFVFDEFHLFGAAQSSSVMIALLLIKTITAPERPPRFLFLSATPQKALEYLAAKAGLEIEIIDGSYQASDNATEVGRGWRRILQPVDLTLYEGRLEEWMQSHVEEVILAFFQQQAGAKGVIIANSVATAHRIYDFLHDKCPAAIRLALNTGLVPRSERGGEFDLLVATSTVDVGVDFRINLLIFESTDANTHIQRLGRLGRHVANKDGNPFERFEAHALLPDWVIKSVTDKLSSDTPISREDYAAAVREAMTIPQEFAQYPRRWAGVQAAHVLEQLKDYAIRSQYETFRKDLFESYRTLFGGSLKRYFALKRDDQQETFNAAQSFRGSSPFTALVRDVSPLHETSEVQAYNLLSLLLRGELDVLDLKALLRQFPALKRGRPLIAYKLLGWLDQPRAISVLVEGSLPPEICNTVIECQTYAYTFRARRG